MSLVYQLAIPKLGGYFFNVNFARLPKDFELQLDD